MSSNLEFLEKNALWIIMDPWEKTPDAQDLIDCPNLDILNVEVINKIVEYIPNLTHVLVSCNKKVHPLLSHLNNLNHNFDLLEYYLKKHDITNVVYMGFHHGECIIVRPTGAANLHQKLSTVELWLKRDLVGSLPWENEDLSDVKSKKYMRFV